MVFGKKQRIINRLLIVEDEPLVAFDNEHLLREAGYEVVATVDRCAEALAVLEDQPIDLILSDVKLTGERNGVELARVAETIGVKLLFVTATCPAEAPSLSVGCLTKPYGQKDLLDALEAIETAVSGGTPKRLPRGLSLYAV